MNKRIRTGAFLFTILLLFLSDSASAQNLDIRILRSINSPEKLPSDRFFRFVSNSDGYLVAGIPVIMGTTAWIKHDDKLLRTSCVALASVALNSVITLALKYPINRTRPFITYPDITKKSAAGSPSFPSGHTSSSFALATSLTLSYPKWYIIIPAYSWAGTVAFSRMDLGVHYPSDVLAGVLIGAGSAWLTHYVNKKLIIKARNKH
jgi:membrane-associated phospholipid phosphatase